MVELFVAAGGGGDALAAAMLARAKGSPAESMIATYAWDRLAVDPVPGPRAVSDFDGLQQLGPRNHVITTDTVPRPPAGSTLPRLAGDLESPLVLLDPAEGAEGMRQQLSDLVAAIDAQEVTVVDVGGDVIAKGDEPGLRSPLADGLALAACDNLLVGVTVLIAGAGLDGELSETDVLTAISRRPTGRLTAEDVAPFRATLDWHPSEATALLAAAALGLRGRVEIRDSGLSVILAARSSDVYELPLADALDANRLAVALKDTTSLAEAEAITRTVCGFCEIDYERKKAKHISRQAPRHNHEPIWPDVEAAIERFEADAAARGVDYVTFRRIAEALRNADLTATELRQHLTSTRPEHLAWPLWAPSRTPVST